MIIGIDYYRTITTNPKIFRKLTATLLNQGCTIYIITAVRADKVALVKDSVKRSKVPHTMLEVVVFKEFEDIPQLKLEACKRLGVRLMFDDLEQVCILLAENNILTAQVR